MAVSLGSFTFTSRPETPSFLNITTLVPPPQVSVHGKLRSTRVLRLAAAAASKPETETKKREPRGIMKPKRVSPEMQTFLGGIQEIPRTQALKEIWAYIKLKDLQDPENKKIIICDEKLKTIFAGKDRVGFLEIAGLLNPHFPK